MNAVYDVRISASQSQGRCISQIRRAVNISRTLGYYVAAKFLANKGWSLEAARYILLGK